MTTSPRPRLRWRRHDPVALADTALALIAVSLVYLRVLFLPLRSMGPSAGSRSLVLAAASALLAVAWAARLLVAQRLAQARQARERALSEERRRAGRLGTLAALSTGLVQDLERTTDEVVHRARSAAPFMGAKAERVVEQAERARAIVRELAASFRGVSAGERQPVDLGRILK